MMGIDGMNCCGCADSADCTASVRQNCYYTISRIGSSAEEGIFNALIVLDGAGRRNIEGRMLPQLVESTGVVGIRFGEPRTANV